MSHGDIPRHRHGGGDIGGGGGDDDDDDDDDRPLSLSSLSSSSSELPRVKDATGALQQHHGPPGLAHNQSSIPSAAGCGHGQLRHSSCDPHGAGQDYTHQHGGHGGLPPDLLVLDVRPYDKLEDAIVQVKLFLESVRYLAMERGLHATGGGPSLFVTIVTGGEDGAQCTVLRSVLQNILRNREIQFMDSADGQSLQVDPLSGTWEDKDSLLVPAANVPVQSVEYGGTVPQGDEYHNADEPHRHQGTLMTQDEQLQQQLPSSRYLSSRDRLRPAPPSPKPPVMVVERKTRPVEDLPHMMPSLQTQQAATLYNPYDSTEHSLLERSGLGGVGSNLYSHAHRGDIGHEGIGGGRGNNSVAGRPQRYPDSASRGGGGRRMMDNHRMTAAVHDPPGDSSHDLNMFAHRDCPESSFLASQTGSIGYPQDRHQGRLPLASPEEAAWQATLLAQAQSSSKISTPTSTNNPVNSPTQDHRSIGRNNLQVEPKEMDEEEFIRLASRQSFLVEQLRHNDADEQSARELERALRESERFARRRREEMDRLWLSEEGLLERALMQSGRLAQEEEERRRRTEEELVGWVVAGTKVAEEAAARDEEELVRMALARSLADDGGRVGEDDLMEEARRASLTVGRSYVGSDGDDSQDVMEWVLKLSLGEKERLSPQEEEDLRKAMEWNKALERNLNSSSRSQVVRRGYFIWEEDKKWNSDEDEQCSSAKKSTKKPRELGEGDGRNSVGNAGDLYVMEKM